MDDRMVRTERHRLDAATPIVAPPSVAETRLDGMTMYDLR